MKRSHILALLPLLPIWTVAAPLGAQVPGPSSAPAVPPGFERLVEAQELLVDIHFGGRKVGETLITARPGHFRFREPNEVLAMLPGAVNSGELADALANDLPSNGDQVCGQMNSGQCGRLSPDRVAAIFNEEAFRVELFVHPRLLANVESGANVYLPSSTSQPSFTNAFGLALSGAGSSNPTYNVQSRTVIAVGNGRLRTNSSYASTLGVIVDDLLLEADLHDLRASAGLFWAPGIDLTGRRRIVGLGLGTQFDTRADRDMMRGTPLVLFLPQPARVEILLDGRLIGSSAHEAGNVLLDTSSLPDGSYSLLLRIQEASGAVREERRFFAKSAQIAPVGQPLYFAYAGLLADTRANRPVSLTDSFYFQFGAARRLSDWLAVDLSVLGTQHKSMAEAGVWLISRHGRARAAVLASPAGDRGGLLQIASSASRGLNINLDVRQIWSSDGDPLIPIAPSANNFGSVGPIGAQVGRGTYTQASGSLGYGLGPAYVALTGSFRKDEGSGADYSIGPSLTWPLFSRNGLQLIMQADAQRTRTTTSSFLGFRLIYVSHGFSALTTTGRSSLAGRGNESGSSVRMTSSFAGQYFLETEGGTQMSASAGIDRALDATTARAGAAAAGRFGIVRGDVLNGFGRGGAIQYGLTFQSGAAFSRDAFGLGGRDLEESALLVWIDGPDDASTFEVLVDEFPRAILRSGGRQPIFLQPYRSYNIRLRPLSSPPLGFDSTSRRVTLYPGNVERLHWQVERLFTAYGRAVRPDGAPVGNATVRSRRDIGQTNDEGFFQIDMAEGETLAFASDQSGTCEVALAQRPPRNDYVSVGKVICR